MVAGNKTKHLTGVFLCYNIRFGCVGAHRGSLTTRRTQKCDSAKQYKEVGRDKGGEN
jgi:hypothetical protein